MIQRSQTVYLIVVIINCMVMLFAGKPYAEITSSVTHVSVDYLHTYFSPASSELFKVVSTNTVLLSHILALVLLSLLCIVLYKNRTLQLRLVMLNFLLIVLLYASMYYQVTAALKEVSATPDTGYTLISIYPVIMLVFNFLAYRGIKKDIDLIKSADRLR